MKTKRTEKHENNCYHWLCVAVFFIGVYTEAYSQGSLPVNSDSSLHRDTTIHIPDYTESFRDADSLRRLLPPADSAVAKRLPLVNPGILLPPVKPLIRSQGQISLDNHFASLQNPYTRSAQSYSRMTYTGHVFLAGLPFQTTAFVTTENNSVYQSNFITVRFDAAAYRRQTLSQAQTKMQSLNKSVNFNRLLLDQLQGTLAGLEQQIRAIPEPAYPELPNPLDTISNPMDSLRRNYRPDTPSSDTLHATKNAWGNKERIRRDSLIQARDSLKEKFTSLYARYREDSMRLAEYKTFVDEGPEALLRDSLSGRAAKHLAWISRVRNFQVGQAIVNYNELSLWGLNIKGVDFQTNVNGWISSVTAGRAFNTEGLSDPLAKPQFNKNLLGLQIGRESKAGDRILASWFYSKDIRKAETQVMNQVLSLDMRKKYRWFLAEVILAGSDLRRYSPVLAGESPSASFNDKENKAILSKFTFDLMEGTAVSLSWNYVGAFYTTIGNPFLRKNYLQKEYTWQQKWLKGKIGSRVFYKKLETLVSELSPEKNTTRGAGLHLQSAFSRGFNFFVLYSPYELGNNHPDTAFRTFNRSSLLSGGVSYMKTWKRIQWFSQLVWSSSTISGDKITATQTDCYSLENTLGIDGIHDLRIEISINRTRPNLDSLNFNALNGQYLRTVRQNLALGGSFKAISFSESSSLIGAGIRLRWLLMKKIQVNSSLEFDRVENWWGVEGRRLVSTAHLQLVYSW